MSKKLFADACGALWGPVYQSTAARELDIGLSSVVRYVNGERAVPEVVFARLGTLLRQREQQINNLILKLPVGA